MLDGNAACVEAMTMARVGVVSAYPITPQSPIAEGLSAKVANGSLNAQYIRVESEHSAMSVAAGAQLTGVRACTATSSIGLILMHEVLGLVSGCRLPIVMPVVNRALAAPWSLWCDHQDTMAVRESGWLQLYCENVQDVYDLLLAAYRIAEDARVQTPAMVCLDGFFLSHSMQKLSIPDQALVDIFLGPYIPKNLVLDTSDPIAINNLIPSDEFTEVRYQQKLGFDRAEQVIDEVFAEFEKVFGRRHSAVEGWRLEDADIVLVTLGSMSGTVKYVVNNLRARGKKVGALQIVSFRPFPAEKIASLLQGARRVAVIDRTASLGARTGPLYGEVAQVLGEKADIRGYIAGLGGRDINPETIERIFADMDAPAREDLAGPIWIDLKDSPDKIRQVLRNV